MPVGTFDVTVACQALVESSPQADQKWARIAEWADPHENFVAANGCREVCFLYCIRNCSSYADGALIHWIRYLRIVDPANTENKQWLDTIAHF